MKHSFKQQSGFSLIELTIVIAILSIVSLVGVALLYNSALLSVKNARLGEVEGQARIAMTRMERSMRMIRANSDISVMTGSAITFVNMDDQTVTIAQNGAQIEYDGNPLVANVTDFQLTYYDSDGAVTAGASDVRYIKLYLKITYQDESYSLETTIFPRNF